MRSGKPHERERSLRRAQTEAERVLWQHLRDRRFNNCKFRRQHRIGPYFADFVCVESNLIVELDGSQHLEQTEYDAARTALLESLGYRVARFWNDDVFLRIDDVLEAISNLMQPLTRPSGTLSPLPRGEGREVAYKFPADQSNPKPTPR